MIILQKLQKIVVRCKIDERTSMGGGGSNKTPKTFLKIITDFSPYILTNLTSPLTIQKKTL